MRVYKVIEIEMPDSAECLVDDKDNTVTFYLNKNMTEGVKERIVAHEIQTLGEKYGFDFNLKWQVGKGNTHTHTHTHTHNFNDSGCE